MHAVRVAEPDAVERTEILDRAVGGATIDKPAAHCVE